MRTKEKHMKKTKWLAACMAACALALVMGCSNGGLDLPGVVEKDGWLMYGSTVRQYRGSDETVTTPAGATIIGSYAFEGTGVKEVTIGKGVTVIEDSAFYQCTSLESVTIPASVKSIEGYAFWGCTSLESVTIGGSVESIGGSAFWGCTSLESVTIPGSVKSIGDYAFSWCDSLTEVKYGGTAEQWKQIDIGSSAFPDGVKITDKDGNVISNS